tara:strand:- start:613 stop:1482 length:870 start_codon:yes stop_codon:yes gene_type:complete
MVIRIFVSFLIFFLVYASLVQFILEPKPHNSPWFLEYKKAESFIVDSVKYKAVIVGSSLSARLNENTISEDCFNLSLAGMGSLQGLKLIKKRKYVPSLIIIEINRVHAEDNPGYMDMLDNKLVVWFKRKFNIFRSDFKPSNYFGFFLKSISDKIKHIYASDAYLLKSENSKTRQVKQIHNNKGFKKVPYNLSVLEQEKISKSLKEIHESVVYFNEMGVQVAFVEMPSYNRADLIKIRMGINKIVAQERSKLIYPKKEMKFKTTDGFHLSDSSSEAYSIYINRELKEMMK